jgi:four helix bundle protein
MLRIYDDMLRVLCGLKVVLPRVEARDADLARQLRRAATSVQLNVAEGSGVGGGNRRQRYLSALGSARETRACLHASEALGYVDALSAPTMDELDKVIATLVKVTR